MTRLIALAAAALLLVRGVAYWQSTQPSPVSLSMPGMAEAQSAGTEVDTSMIQEMVLGNEDAAVTVIEYASYTCPHCRDFHENVFDELKKNYIDNGKIKFAYREVYFDRFGLWAAMVARCGDGSRYFPISGMIYDRQAEWIKAGDPAAIADALTKIGIIAGLEADQVNACLRDVDKAQAMVAVYQQNARADDITGTPSFIINGTKYSNMSYADFSALLDEKLGS